MHLMLILVAAFAVSFSSHAATVPTAPPPAAATASGTAKTAAPAAATTAAPATTGTPASASNSSAAATTQSSPCANKVCASGFTCQVNMSNEPMCVPAKDSIFWLAWFLAKWDD